MAQISTPVLAPARRRLHVFLLVSAVAVLLWSGAFPSGRFNWFMEVVPALLGAAVLLATYRRFPLADITYVLIWLFALILMVGGHYTYAKVPLGAWVQEAFALSRNHYDRLGHLFQGVVPAMVGRELLLRTSPLKRGRWLAFCCVAAALTVSSAYELFEWGYAVTFGGEQADDFLGSQGDIWDAQKDMACAFIGAVAALSLFAALQNRQLRRMGVSVDGEGQQG